MVVNVPSVSSERKNELLIKARHSRLKWVKSSSIPYRQQNYRDSSDDDLSNSKNDPISILDNSSVCHHLPSTIPILRDIFCNSHLDRKSLDAASKESQALSEWRNRIQQKQASRKRDELAQQLDDHAFIFYYTEVIERLCKPECMDVVQGMKCFVRKFIDIGKSLVENDKGKKNNNKVVNDIQNNQASEKEEDWSPLVNSIQTYLSSLHDELANHSSWREGSELSNETKMMLDTFIYSKCDHVIKMKENIIDDKLEKDENDLRIRLEFLQFINPSHLDIHYFTEQSETEDQTKWKMYLSQPSTLLKSLNQMFSPAQMLRCILEVYRAVTNALKIAIENSSPGKVPSADDVLPALILTLILAKPSDLPTSLRFLENFATQEQLRGEAGYAFTNLFSATQFIRELDLDQSEIDKNGGKNGLSIDAQVFKEKLIIFRKATDFSDSIETEDIKDETKHDTVSEDIKDKTRSYEAIRRVHIPVRKVTDCRLRGENVEEWAKQYGESLLQENPGSWEIPDDQTCTTKTSLTLPKGFTRTYKYLATEPEEIRISDIPSLLEEYRMLAKVTETLIYERDSKARLEQQKEIKSKKVDLDKLLLEASNPSDDINIK